MSACLHYSLSLSPWPSPGVQLGEFIMYCIYVYSWFWLLINPLHLGRRANSWPTRSSFRNEAANHLANRAWWKRHCAAAPGCRAAVPWQITTWGARAAARDKWSAACNGQVSGVYKRRKTRGKMTKSFRLWTSFTYHIISHNRLEPAYSICTSFIVFYRRTIGFTWFHHQV